MAGCIYSDTLLAFCFLEAVNLSENDEKFVLTAVDLEKGYLTDQIKASLKKFQERAFLLTDKEDMKFELAMVIKMEDALMAHGWK